jgi:hypothetical protein
MRTAACVLLLLAIAGGERLMLPMRPLSSLSHLQKSVPHTSSLEALQNMLAHDHAAVEQVEPS